MRLSQPPMRTPPTRTPSGSLRARHITHCVLLTALCGVCFAYRVADPSLWRSQEDRVAWIVRTMLRTGDVITPRGPKGIVFDDKPPLYHWLATLASVGRPGHAPSRFTLRLPSVVFGTLLVLLVYLWASSCWGPGAGLVAGAVLATSAKVIGAAGAARVDLMLALWLTVMLAAGWLAYRGTGRRRAWALVAFYAAAAAVTLTKGPVLALLPVAALLLLLAARRDLRAVRSFRPLAGIGLVLLLCGWWFIAVHVTSDGEFTRGFFVKHHWQRYVGGEPGGHFRAGVFYKYLPLLIGGALPWSVLIGFAVVVAVRDWCRGRLRADSDGPADRRADEPTRLLLIWVVLVVVAFSLGRVKRADYILPVFPALALLMGRAAFGPAAARDRRWLIRGFLLNVVAAVVLCLVLSGLAFTPLGSAALQSIAERGSHTDRAVVARYLALLTEQRRLVWLAGMVLVGGAATSWGLARSRRVRAAFVVFAACTALLTVIYTTVVLPESEPIRSRSGLAGVVRQMVRRGDRLFYVYDGAFELSYDVDLPADWVGRENVLTRDAVDRWTDGGRARCFLVMRRSDYDHYVAPRERALGLTVVAASIPSHVRPLVVLSNRTQE